MSALLPVGLIAALVAGGAVLSLVHAAVPWRLALPALAATALALTVTVAAGVALDAAPVWFLVGVAAFVLPIVVLLEAAAAASGVDRFARGVLLAVWAGGVFPAAFLVPLLITRDCVAAECAVQDFGASLPLFVSSSAFVLLAWLPAGVVERPAPLDRRGGLRAIVAIAVFWVAFAGWLVHLEGAVDDYLPRILLAAAVVPVAGGVGWLVVDRLRAVPRPPIRSFGFGLIVGIVAAAPGAVSVGMPWAPLVGLLAGALAALVFSTRAAAASGLAARWALAVLVAALVGFLAPPISGDTVGIVFTARFAILVTPAIVFGVTALASILVSAPVWVVVRRHAARERIPAALLGDQTGEAAP